MSFSFFVDFGLWFGFLSYWINWIVANPNPSLTEDNTCDWLFSSQSDFVDTLEFESDY